MGPRGKYLLLSVWWGGYKSVPGGVRVASRLFYELRFDSLDRNGCDLRKQSSAAPLFPLPPRNTFYSTRTFLVRKTSHSRHYWFMGLQRTAHRVPTHRDGN